MSFLGGPVEALESLIWEQKPDVPSLPRIDLAQQQLDTTKGNLAALPGLETIGRGVDDFQRAERAKTLATIPGLQDLETLTLGNLGDWMRGQIPHDVQNAIATSGAGRALAGGYGGSGMGTNLVARDLGLTSLGLQQSAVPMAQNFIGQEFGMRNVPQYDPTTQFINPLNAAQFYDRQNQEQFNRNWLAERIAAQPEPWQQSIMNSTQQGGAIFDKIFQQAASSYLGGGMSGMMGGGGGGMGAGIGSSAMQGAMAGGAQASPMPAGTAYNYESLGNTGYNPYNLGGYNYGSYY